MNALECAQYYDKIKDDLYLYKKSISEDALAVFMSKLIASRDCNAMRKVLCDAMGYAWLDGIKYQLNGEKLP